jgi:hypothetical protein
MQRTKSGVSEAPVYIFQGEAFGPGSDGANPVSAVVMGSKGNLYGTTDYGESAAVGTLYELSPNESGRWREKVLYTFTHSADGGHPSGLILDAAGTYTARPPATTPTAQYMN